MQTDAISILLANQQAEEIKRTTISLRRFYPGCLVEAVYSLEELSEWVSKLPWHVILLDQRLLRQSATSVLPELRRSAPKAVIILQCDDNDIALAMEAMEAGADYCLCDQSSTFLTDLSAVMNTLLEKRERTLAVPRSRWRDAQLIERVLDLVYELDTEGRFVYVSPAVGTLLGYAPEELIGSHYSKVLPSGESRLAQRRFDERRTGDRATRNLKLRLASKGNPSEEGLGKDLELNAEGMYAEHGQFLGTVGVVRHIGGRMQEQLHQEQKMEALAGLTSGIIFDLNALLVAMAGYSRILLQGLGQEDLRRKKFIEQIEKAGELSTELARQFQAFSRSQVPRPVEQGLKQVLPGMDERFQDRSTRTASWS